METRNEQDIKRLAPGESVKVAGKFGGIIERRDETENRTRFRFAISCSTHDSERRRYSDTLKFAVLLASDTSTWCKSCAAQWDVENRPVAQAE